jgi:hypothetical protein
MLLKLTWEYTEVRKKDSPKEADVGATVIEGQDR